MNKKPNRLINEKSPYLLQHAYNPVDWYPWGEEAFERAQCENRLIFLSIGYSTCHWCHEMAHNAFSDKKTAKYLNENFVSIKVDREERPDIDEIYMLACQHISANCGWPLNIIMTTDKMPIFATTYLPSIESFGRKSLLDILQETNELWLKNNDKFFEVGKLILNEIKSTQEYAKDEIEERTLEKAFEIFQRNFDNTHGGFGQAPKFPTPHNLNFLLKWYEKLNEKSALEMVKKTLDSMYKGGIFDHVGGGFHRYSTDNRWFVPHFEKTLYDQALIANAYIEAYIITENQFYSDVAKKILDFVLKELISPEGVFYSGLDADTEGVEGKFYTWKRDEIFKILDKDAELFCLFYGVTSDGNYEPGKNILYIEASVDDFCKKYNLNHEDVKNKLDNGLKKLYKEREKRIRPNIDDKIITSWNGLVIQTLALAGRIFDEEKYKNAAIKAAKFIMERLISENNEVFRIYHNNEKPNITGFLDDYAFIIYGLLDLHKTTNDNLFLGKAKLLTEKMISEFYDEKDGGFYLTPKNFDTPLFRIKHTPDYALPSGNSIAVLDLLTLNDVINTSDYELIVRKTFSCFGQNVNQYPTSYSQLLIALMHTMQ